MCTHNVLVSADWVCEVCALVGIVVVAESARGWGYGDVAMVVSCGWV